MVQVVVQFGDGSPASTDRRGYLSPSKSVTLSTLESEDVAEPLPPTPSVDLAPIEETSQGNPLTGPLMHRHPDLERTYLVEVDGEKHPMTFSREVYDHNPEVGFMTYGHPVFEALLGLGTASQ